MKNWKTTAVGCMMAALMAAKPILDGSGYHLDKKTIAELTFAVLMAIGGVLVKDYDVTGKP